MTCNATATLTARKSSLPEPGFPSGQASIRREGRSSGRQNCEVPPSNSALAKLPPRLLDDAGAGALEVAPGCVKALATWSFSSR